MKLTRRDILVGISSLVLVKPAAALAEAGAKAAAGFSLSSSSVPFTKDERATLAAAVDRLLPGAAEAGVPEYIGFWLSQTPFQGLKRYISAGLDVLDKAAQKNGNARFADSPAKARDALLKTLAKGDVRLKKFDGKLFFQKLLELTLEGFLSDPRYGGNRDRVGWRFIGIPDGLGSCWWNPDGVNMVLNPDDGFTD